MGTTPTYALPYPELTDVANVPADMRELAEATATALALGSTAVGAWTNSLAQSIPNNTPTRVTLDTPYLAPVGMTFASSQATIVTPGLYLLMAALTFDQSNTTGFRIGMLVINGASASRASNPPSASSGSTTTMLRLARLTAGDVVAMNAQQTSGTAVNLTFGNGYTHLGLIRLGA